jgi:hypothetical protein
MSLLLRTSLSLGLGALALAGLFGACLMALGPGAAVTPGGVLLGLGITAVVWLMVHLVTDAVSGPSIAPRLQPVALRERDRDREWAIAGRRARDSG